MSRKNKHSVPAGSKQWVHPNEALLRGHIVYNTKFLGTVKVDEPKGTEVVKDAIRKMKFNKQIKKAEGVKSPKVELTISVDGVTVQEPKYKVIQHQYPLHRISYCADDKSDKRMFTFIAKAADSNQHHCFVFDSEKCAEEITLTIGQAFDLAYKRFLDTAGRDMDMRKQVLLSQKKIQHLTEENLQLKAQVADLERLIDPKVLETYDRMKKEKQQPSSTSQDAVVGRKLENLVFDDDKNVDNLGAEKHSNGNVASSPVYSTPAPLARAAPAQPAAAANSPLPRLAPPPPVPARNNIPTSPTGNQPPPSAPGAAPTARQGQQGVDLFGAEPFVAPTTNGTGGAAATDAFGMPSFSAVSSAPQSDLDQQIQNVDQELMDLQTGFSQGLSYGTEDFSLDDLDPLKK